LVVLNMVFVQILTNDVCVSLCLVDSRPFGVKVSKNFISGWMLLGEVKTWFLVFIWLLGRELCWCYHAKIFFTCLSSFSLLVWVISHMLTWSFLVFVFEVFESCIRYMSCLMYAQRNWFWPKTWGTKCRSHLKLFLSILWN